MNISFQSGAHVFYDRLIGPQLIIYMGNKLSISTNVPLETQIMMNLQQDRNEYLTFITTRCLFTLINPIQIAVSVEENVVAQQDPSN